jgi:hypothetical protein
MKKRGPRPGTHYHRRMYIGRDGDPYTTFAFRYRSMWSIPRDLVQRVWEGVTADPQATIRTLA